MASIFNINNWATSTIYSKNSIVKNGSYYYYALVRHTSTTFSSDSALGYWGGTISDSGVTLPLFLWTPSYSLAADFQPVIKTIKFGDGYEQSLEDGLFNTLLNFNITFDNRDLDETTAILHFLYERKGAKSFVWISPAPYSAQKRFKCKQWSSKQNFYNDFSMNAVFNETVK